MANPPRFVNENLSIASRAALSRLKRINNSIESEGLTNVSTGTIKIVQDMLSKDLDVLPDIKVVNNMIDKNLVAMGKELERRGEHSPSFANMMKDSLDS